MPIALKLFVSKMVLPSVASRSISLPKLPKTKVQADWLILYLKMERNVRQLPNSSQTKNYLIFAKKQGQKTAIPSSLGPTNVVSSTQF